MSRTVKASFKVTLHFANLLTRLCKILQIQAELHNLRCRCCSICKQEGQAEQAVSKGLWLTSDQHRFLAADFMVNIIFREILFTPIVALGNSENVTSHSQVERIIITSPLEMFVPTPWKREHSHISAGWRTSLFALGGVREAVYIDLNSYRRLRLVYKREKIVATLTDPEAQTCEMHCNGDLVNYLSCGIILTGLWQLVRHRKTQTSYGRHMGRSSPDRMVPARLAWFLQELPALLIPLLLMLTSHKPSSMGKYLLLGTFCMHYFQR